jgi:hypothetical protein
MNATRLLAVALTASGICAATPAAAWGPNGHAIVADIAELHLTPAARQQVRELLGSEGHTRLDDVSSWADDWRPSHPQTAPWHFVDIPLNAATFDADRDCAGGNCVTAKIVDYAKVLADKSAPVAQRTEALKFIVHFVGDVHQPLHCEDNDDRGGNSVNVTFFGHRKNLHSVWDDGLLEQATGLRTTMPGYKIDHEAAQTAALNMDGTIAPGDAAQWAPAGLASSLPTVTITWANESHALARPAYDKMIGTRLNEDYEDAEWPVVRAQLERGGIRLAELLNEILQ